MLDHLDFAYLFACWEILHAFLSSADFFYLKIAFKKIFYEIPLVSNSLDPDQARQFVRPDLGPNYLHVFDR